MICADCFFVKFCPNDPRETPCSKFIKKENVIVAPCAIGDTVYYISGVAKIKSIKAAKVEEITYNGADYTLCLVTQNNVYFDLPADKVHYTKESAQKYI